VALAASLSRDMSIHLAHLSGGGRVKRQERIPAVLLMQDQGIEARAQRRSLQILWRDQRRIARSLDVAQKRLQPFAVQPSARCGLP
jgi:hypothetical protein